MDEHTELILVNTKLRVVTLLYLSLHLIMFCYHSVWHVRDWAVREHTLDWSLWPSLAWGTWFSVQAQSSGCCLLLFLGFSSCPVVFFPSLVLGKHKTFFRKHSISENCQYSTVSAVDPCSWPPSPTLLRTWLPHPLPQLPWQTHAWTVTSENQHDLHKWKAASINGSKGYNTM